MCSISRVSRIVQGSPVWDEGKALERKSSSVNTGFVFVLMAGLAKRMCV